MAESKNPVTEEAKALTVEVYKDAAKPAVSEIGATLGAAAKLVLWPVRKIVEGANSALDRLSNRVGQKLSTVPPDRQLPPPATILAPAALQYALLGEGDEVAGLREMFENLLVTSMDRSTTASAHPAFVSMIEQLTPDEAWLLKSIDRAMYAAVDLVRYAPTREHLGLRTVLGRGIGIDESRCQRYISNLDRLGILRVDWNVVADQDAYDHLRTFTDQEFTNDDFPPSISSHAGAILVTPLGQEFLATCVRSR